MMPLGKSAAAVTAFLLLALPPPAVTAGEATPAFLLSTSHAGGVYDPLGRSLCHLYTLDRPAAAPPAGLPLCRVQRSAGSVENIERLRRGEAEVAIVQSDVLHWAWLGAGPFDGVPPFHDVATLFAAHDEVVTVLVGAASGIATAEDLPGKRVAVSVQASGSRATLDAFMEALGWTPASFAAFEILSVAEQTDALCGGRVDAIAYVVGHPSGYVQRALYDCGARLLPLDDPGMRAVAEKLPFLRMAEIPANTYRGQAEAVPAPGLTALVVARRDWQAEQARAFVAAIRAHVDILRRMHPALSDIDLGRLDGAAEEIGLHPAVAP
jgi:TRAP transporter TAXI family solute receptor